MKKEALLKQLEEAKNQIAKLQRDIDKRNRNDIRLIQHKEEEEVNKSETDGTVTIPLKRYLELLRIEQGR